MKVLQLTSHYFPNIGGVETHLSDLVKVLSQKHQVFVLTYRPLTTKAEWPFFEKTQRTTILRVPWLPGLFNKLSIYPALEFLYLLPGLFITLPFILMFFKPEVIHSHGLVAGFVGAFWGKLFGIRTVISTHSIYHFPQNGVYRLFAKLIFGANDQILCLSDQSVREIQSLGVRNVSRFVYWIDLKKFKPMSQAIAKKELNWKSKFSVLFVGRLVKEKGILVLDEAALELKKFGILAYVAGNGPEFGNIKNCILLGPVSQEKLPLYYNAADLLIVPSIHEEGFGRVVIESLACGTPVIASNRGALPEAIDDSVGRLIDITPENTVKAILDLKNNLKIYSKLKSNTRKFTLKRYGTKNLFSILDSYCQN